MKPPVLVFETPAAGWAVNLLGARASALGWFGLVLAVSGFVWLVSAGWQLAHAEQRRTALQARLDAGRVPTVQAPTRSTGSERALNAQRVRAWNAVARQLNTPWTALLDTLEALTPADVALVAVEPDAMQGTVRLQAEARTLQALLAYEQALRAAPLFHAVALARHETNENESVRPVRLHLVLRMQTAQGVAAK
jgi:Tfp pilus assembly protein PilN